MYERELDSHLSVFMSVIVCYTWFQIYTIQQTRLHPYFKLYQTTSISRVVFGPIFNFENSRKQPFPWGFKFFQGFIYVTVSGF